jgi:hypothetical protein
LPRRLRRHLAQRSPEGRQAEQADGGDRQEADGVVHDGEGAGAVQLDPQEQREADLGGLWKPPTPPGVGMARPITARMTRKKLAGNGKTTSKA